MNRRRAFPRHPADTPLLTRLMARVDEQGPLGCWLWLSTTNADGYGIYRVRLDGGRRSDRGAHVLVWEQHHGKVPDGKLLDHLCRVRHCVRPAHLEPVPFRVNVLRGVGPTAQNARRTHCIAGHELTPDNTYLTREGHRHCRRCALRRAAQHKARRRLEIVKEQA